MRSSKLLTLTTLAFALTAQSAQAADLTPVKAQAVADSLGDKGAGAYFDSARGEIVVAVTDEAAAEKVEAAGGSAEIVENSTADLEAVKETIDTSANVPGMAWAVDPQENKVVITVDQSVDAGELAHVKAGVEAAGDAVRIERVEGTFSPYISGGQAITTGGSRCSLGFNVKRGGVDHFLTAGHCTRIGTTWSGGGSVLGSVLGSSFPGNDYGIVRYTTAAPRPGNVSLYNGAYQDIASARNAIPGEPAKRSGSTTGLRSGTIQAVNQSVNYGAQGVVSGLIRTNICAQPGDSGGPLFTGTVALGLTSGGSGNCTTGGTTFFQPVTEALSVYGAQVY